MNALDLLLWLLIAVLIVALVYWLAGLLLPYPFPAIFAVLALIGVILAARGNNFHLR